MVNEPQKMLASMRLAAERANSWFDQELKDMRSRARAILRRFNAPNCSEGERLLALNLLLGSIGENVIVLPHFQCHYGYNIKCGRNVFINRDCVFLDAAEIEIGDGVQIFPGVQIHTDGQLNKPVRIGENAIIGGGTMLMPGVTIGKDAIIAARSIITLDVPDGALVEGS